MSDDSETTYQKGDIEIDIQLGDVIRIKNPVNEKLNEQTFIIDYIDNSKTYLINTDTLDRIKLKILDNGILGDGNITMIEILSRADSPSYARQNSLLPGKWLKIYFSEPTPAIIVGEITNLEEDMIEIKTTDEDTIYINFDYKGIPENLPIDNIEIIGKPIEEKIIIEQEESQSENVIDIPNLEPEKVAVDDLQITVPIKQVKEQLREIILKADQVSFGDEELGPIVQFVDTVTKHRRYSIEEQVTDLLDDLLSTIPNAERTPRILNNIHTMIERFKQLRETFSSFDKYGNVESIIFKQATYKPLTKWLGNFNKNLYWILPVVRNIKKIYNEEDIDEDNDEDNNDVINLDIGVDLNNMAKLIQSYKSNNLSPTGNAYTTLYSDLSNYFRPFEYLDADRTEDIIGEKYVNANINVVIDNLEQFYSSVFSNNMVRNRRFVITKYSLSNTKLQTIDLSLSKINTVRVKITDNDLMSIRSIMTLPEPTIRFSRINLPGTDILTKANLNKIFFNYWQLFKKKTNIINTFVESFENALELNENDFVSGIRNYVLNLSSEEMRGATKEQLYSKYIETIVPKTRILFKLMKKYINGKLSIVDVVSYLEPFMIYTDDLTFQQYREIVEFIDLKISEYNKQIIEFSKIFKIMSSIRQLPVTKSKAFSILTLISPKLNYTILNTGYHLEKPEGYMTNSEILRKILFKDQSKLFSTAIAYDNLNLMFSENVSDIFDVEKNNNDNKLKEIAKTNTCKSITIAKMYTSLEQLENDNYKLIYFDKKYDKTNYGLMEEDKGYSQQVMSLTPEKLKDYIIQDQIKKYNLTEADAEYIADTLIDGTKKVIDGQYAILYKGYAENISDESDYYIRKDDKWIIDKELTDEQKITDEPSIICDLQEKCISVTEPNNNCESIKTRELNLQNSLLKSIISEFDTKYKFSKEEVEKDISRKFEYFMSIIPMISKIETNMLLKYNNEKYRLSLNIEGDETQVISPFNDLLDMILSQKDFVKRQNDIIKFCNKFTRPASDGIYTNGQKESKHWLYCIKTNTHLLPTFKKTLASAFLESQYRYKSVLEQVKSEIGQISDDGDWWTDKYTGWAICPGDFDTEEGYDDGFKIVTRAIIEEEAGNKIMSTTTEKTIKYITPETIMINNIINTLSIAMGINIETQKELIINSVVELIRTNVESENDYKEKIKMAKKSILSYKDFFNTSILYFTLGMFLIAIQTSIPSVKTRKTYPGCVRSFTGYPFEGQGDYSSVAYLACVTHDIKTSGQPWNVLKRTNSQKIQTKIQQVIDTLIIQLPEVQRKFQEKSEYLLTNQSNEIPEEHDISKWTDFLPPLIPFKIKHLTNISDEFKRSLVNDLKNGSKQQRERILVIQSKILQFSLAIQERIQKIVKQHTVLLHTNNNEPYLENACCDSKEKESTIDYFNNRNNEIIEFNKIIERLANMLDDVRSNTESVLFFSKINTKNIYPTISNKFNEKTIYLAFIFYCKFNSLIPIPGDLLPICTNKPNQGLIDSSMTIDKIIQILKEDGRNYSNEQFLRLIELVSRGNIVNIQLDNPIISCIAKLSILLDDIYNENNEDELIEQSLRDLIKNAIDTFDIATETMTSQVKNLNNYLIRTNEEMKKDLIQFVQNNGSKVTRNIVKKFTETINNLSYWNCDDSKMNEHTISNDDMYNITNFYKTFVKNFVSVFPNIILNKVDYQSTNIPKYYGFSKIHTSKLVKNIANYFEKLIPFYDTTLITKVLTTVQKLGKNLIKLAESTPCFSSIKTDDKTLRGIIDERTSRYLFEHYLLSSLIAFIDLADNNNMIVAKIDKTIEVTDIFSADYIEEIETRIDLGMSNEEQFDYSIVTGNLRELKEKITELLIAFVKILSIEKNSIDISYQQIQDRIFKLKEKEKNMVTDRLKAMTDEQRDADRMLKITKLGNYSKGLQKGLTMYDVDFYEREDEQNLREEMEKAERKFRSKNNVTDDNIDDLIGDYLEERQVDEEINRDAYDLSYLGEDYYDGNYTGIDAPEYETYEDED